MKSRKVLLPEGVQDLLIDDCIYRRHIEDKLMNNFMKSGYMEVNTPSLEYYDLFSNDYLASNGDKMFKLIDTNGGILVLRPDCTIPIARMVATKMKDFVYPLKLCYVQNVFRIDEEQAGKKREFRQAGVELFGVASYEADVEVIITAIESLKNLGLKNFQIDIGQVKLLRSILEKLIIEEKEKQEIEEHIENKNFIELDKLVNALKIEEEIKEILKKLPRLFGEPEEVLGEVKALPLDAAMLEAVEDLEKVCDRIAAYGLGKYISLDLGMVTMMKYYSGIIFKGFTRDLGTVLLSGGRYDRLLEDFGIECAATGFAFIVNKITKALKIQENLKVQRSKHILLLAPQVNLVTAQTVEKLRTAGHVVEICLLENTKDLQEYTQRRKIDEVIKIDDKGEIQVLEDLGGW
ncbi:ATP phosphoribosyltransferase regulatory subunit [Clostridium formicaceticum]|uniref:ATP phosphoribosyltransferase regulatory subunit n=1 Tax=Clostridium formicaceticum TaxID=1497 RepID=A0AAC9RIA8_9CLOT|nr:ATP phosphoribosyltransferase regulatory subunit [Clostridium formicaceticum]AOY75551.1 ATP phosphoribosyltransferase regulatory subunit [Clostridium formicaceticum]ARE85848.1 ATP phosphoribosyltransferase regulatory subunit [Clostridium formicaceticum]